MSGVRPSRPRRRRPTASLRGPVLAALVASVALGVVVFYAFSGVRPLSEQRTVKVAVANAYLLKSGDPVRVAGQKVGQVKGVESGPDGTAVLRLGIDDQDLVVHRDAHATIYTRLFIEGSFYVELRPGSPTAPVLDAAATLPIEQTSGPVQLDQVVSLLTQPTRTALIGTVGELGTALQPDGPAPRPVPLRRAVQELGTALGPASIVARAARGVRGGDLGATLRGTAAVTSQLASDPRALADLVTNTRRTMGALGADDRALAGSVRQLNRLVRETPAQLPAIDRALTATRTLARAADPTLIALPRSAPTITALLREFRTLSAPALLPRALRLASPVIRDLPELSFRLEELAGELRPAVGCIRAKVLPTLEAEVPDGKLSSGRPSWQDGLHALTGLAGVSPGFDANGTTIRLGPTEGASTLEGVIPGVGHVVGTGPGAPIGVRPAPPYDANPPFRPDARCTEQPLVDLSAGLSAQPLLHASKRSAATALSPASIRKLLTRLAEAPRVRALRPAKDRPEPQGATGRPPALARPTVPKPLTSDLPAPVQTVQGVVDRLLGLGKERP